MPSQHFSRSAVIVAAIVVAAAFTVPLVTVADVLNTEDFEDGNADGWDLNGNAAVVNTSIEGDHSVGVETGSSNTNSANWTSAGPVSDGPHRVTFTWRMGNVKTTSSRFASVYVGNGVEMIVRSNSNLGSGWKDLDLYLFGSMGNNSQVLNVHDVTWYNAEVLVEQNQAKLKVWPHGTTRPAVYNVSTPITSTSGGAPYYVKSYDNGVSGIVNFTTDDVQHYDVETINVTGTVTDGSGDPIENASVTISRAGTTVTTTRTDDTGSYELQPRQKNVTYNITATKNNYTTSSESFSGQSNTVIDFTLLNISDQLTLEAPRLLEHGDEADYSVTFTTINNSTGELVTEDVTENATVTSDNTNALTVEPKRQKLVATQNKSINVEVVVTANYTANNRTYTAERNVTVASLSLDNIKIMPGAYRISASFADNADAKNDPTKGVNPMFAILIATLVGIVGSRFATSFAGLSLMTIALVVAWFGGWLGTGMMLVGIMTASFIGLNVAANIEYGVIKG